MIQELKSHYLPDRVSQVDLDFLAFEEEMSQEQDISSMLDLLNSKTLPVFQSNPTNSILLWVTGLSDCFDFGQARCLVRGGAPPD